MSVSNLVPFDPQNFIGPPQERIYRGDLEGGMPPTKGIVSGGTVLQHLRWGGHAPLPEPPL